MLARLFLVFGRGVIALAAPAADRPNVVLLMGDDHGWDETGYNGHPYLRTPVLDEIARTGLRPDTLLWYCGDNGTPAEAVATVPFRGQKGTIYEGGIRVLGLIEWPAKITRPRTTDLNTVTTDILPTLCDLIGRPPPRRLLEIGMTERAAPIFFWGDPIARHPGAKPYLDPELQKGTSLLVKLGPDGAATRNFLNFQHAEILDQDFAGPRAVLDHRYKLVIDGAKSAGRELFDLRADPAEKNNLIATHPTEARV